jgi:hypothetical protein
VRKQINKSSHRVREREGVRNAEGEVVTHTAAHRGTPAHRHTGTPRAAAAQLLTTQNAEDPKGTICMNTYAWMHICLQQGADCPFISLPSPSGSSIIHHGPGR